MGKQTITSKIDNLNIIVLDLRKRVKELEEQLALHNKVLVAMVEEKN